MNMTPELSGLSQLLFAAFDSALGPSSAIYAAGPLDTGLAYYEALGRNEAGDTVRALNQQRLTGFVSELRKRFHPISVIDPGLLRVPSWAPRETGQFFLDVISRYAREARFIDGWEYSSGATKEFLHCIGLGIPCFSANGDPLSIVEAISLLSSAIQNITDLGLDVPKLRERLIGFRQSYAKSQQQ